MKFEEFYELMKKDKSLMPDSQRENEKYYIKDVYDCLNLENISEKHLTLYKKIFDSGFSLGNDERAEKDIEMFLEMIKKNQ